MANRYLALKCSLELYSFHGEKFKNPSDWMVIGKLCIWWYGFLRTGSRGGSDYFLGRIKKNILELIRVELFTYSSLSPRHFRSCDFNDSLNNFFLVKWVAKEHAFIIFLFLHSNGIYKFWKLWSINLNMRTYICLEKTQSGFLPCE